MSRSYLNYKEKESLTPNFMPNMHRLQYSHLQSSQGIGGSVNDVALPGAPSTVHTYDTSIHHDNATLGTPFPMFDFLPFLCFS